MKTAGNVMIRKITSLDIKSIVDIENQCFRQTWSEKNIKDAIENERNILLCAIKSGKLCGYLFADFVLDEVNINRLATKPDSRNSGVAESLLCELEEYVGNFAECIMLEVRKGNVAARNLYEKNGFKTVGVRKGFYSAPFEDAILMTKFLKEMER